MIQRIQGAYYLEFQFDSSLSLSLSLCFFSLLLLAYIHQALMSPYYFVCVWQHLIAHSAQMCMAQGDLHMHNYDGGLFKCWRLLQWLRWP